MLSSEYGSGSTCHRIFQQWVKLDIFRKIRILLLDISMMTALVSSGLTITT
jgi:hypothetical protein